MTPPPFPAVLFVEPTNACNFRCGVCPESLSDYKTQAGYFQRMMPETWDAVFQSICNAPPPGGEDPMRPVDTIRFWGMGEPLLNPALPTMIHDVRHLARRTELATNGTLLNYYAEALIDSHLSYLRVSIYGGTEDYSQQVGRNYSAKQVLDAVKFFRDARTARGSKTPFLTAHLMAPESDIPEFKATYEGIADHLSIDVHHNWGGSESRLVSISNEPAKQDLCPKPFRELYVKSNGDVSVCCLDWDGKLIVGNVLKQSLQEIWEGPLVIGIRAKHEQGRKGDLVACRDCNFRTRDAKGNLI